MLCTQQIWAWLLMLLMLLVLPLKWGFMQLYMPIRGMPTVGMPIADMTVAGLPIADMPVVDMPIVVGMTIVGMTILALWAILGLESVPTPIDFERPFGKFLNWLLNCWLLHPYLLLQALRCHDSY